MDAKTSPLAQLNDPSLLKTDALIGGDWVKGSARFDVFDPATGQRLADVANLGPAEAEAAIAAANKAWPAWRAKTAKERAAVLMKWFQLLHQHADDLARIMTAEQGKPLAEAKGEVGYGASFLEWFAEEARRIYGETIPSTDNNKRLPGHQAADRRVRGDHAVELPDRDDHAQGGAGAGRRLPGDHQAGRADAAVGAGGGRAGAARRHAGRRAEHPDRRRASTRSTIGKVLCASDVVRHLSFTGSTEVGRILARAMRADDQEAEPGTGRQRALHRLRRCRPGQRGRRRDDQQVPQRRPDLRLRQPPLCAGRHLRRLRRQAGRARPPASRWATASRPASTRAR